MGGAERFTFDLIHSLKNQGHTVNLATLDRPNWNRIGSLFPDYTPPDNHFYALPFRLPIFGVYQRLAMIHLRKKLSDRCDLTINTHSDHLYAPCDITYMHGVPEWGMVKGLKRVYYLPYLLLTKRKLEKGNIPNSYFIANSRFTAKRLLKHQRIKAQAVVYPPVHTEEYRHLLTLFHHYRRQNLTLTISRFGHEKNLAELIRIFDHLKGKDITGIVVGHANTPLERRNAEALKRQAKQKDLNIHFLVNISQYDKRSLLAKSKVYLHINPTEHFGIALAEAMSAGCLPVACHQGGHREVMGGEGLVYRDSKEAGAMIEEGLDQWSPSVAERVSGGVERFNLERFTREIMGHIEKVVGTT